MKKVSDILLTVFSVGVLAVLFAGGISLLGYIAAMFIGGETATNMCVFIHKTYFPYVIRFASVFVGVGLLGMYLSKIKALALTGESDKAEEGKSGQ